MSQVVEVPRRLSLNQYREEKDVPKKDRYEFAILLLETFGLQFASYLSKTGSPKPVFKSVSDSFGEIQQQIQRGRWTYFGDEFPKTAALISKYRAGGESDEAFFSRLCTHLCRALPFPQEILFCPIPDLDIDEALQNVKEIEATLSRSLSQIFQILNGEDPRLPDDYESGMIKVYYSGVFISGQRVVYLSEVISRWAGIERGQKTTNQDRLLEKIPNRDMVQDHRSNGEKGVVAVESSSATLQEYLARASIHAIETNLKFKLPSRIGAELVKTFIADESIRADCYITGDPIQFFKVDLNRLRDRPSVHLLKSFQILLFLIREYRLPLSQRSYFFAMIHSRDSEWGENRLRGFSERNWEAPNQESTGIEGWAEYLSLLKTMAYQENTTPSLLFDPCCWPLFVDLWFHPNRQAILTLFRQLFDEGVLPLNLETIRTFVHQNGEVLTDTNMGMFLNRYLAVLQILEYPKCGGNLFIDPPLDMANQQDVIPNAVARTIQFTEAMDRFRLEKDRDYVRALRKHIFDPCDGIVYLSEDTCALGIRSSPHLLVWEALSLPRAILPRQGDIVSSENRGIAIGRVLELKNVFGFDERQTFFLYLEALRLQEAGQLSRFNEISRPIQALCGASFPIKTAAIYLLHLHQIEIPLSSITTLKGWRTNWFRSKVASRSSIVPKLSRETNQEGIKEFIDSFLGEEESLPLRQVEEDSSLRKHDIENLRIGMNASLLSGFYPPTQPLTDFMHISGVDPVLGIVWQGVETATHEGQLKMIVPNGVVGVYLNWSVEEDEPLLFFSFVDMAQKIAKSEYCPIRVSIQNLRESGKELLFYRFLDQLCRMVLVKEEPDVEQEEGELFSAFNGVDSLIESYRESLESVISSVLEFVKRVKVLYRSHFLDIVESQVTPVSSDPSQIARSGDLFFVEGERSLLPETHLRSQSHREWYLPDVPRDSVARYMARFSQEMKKWEPLNLALRVNSNAPVQLDFQVHFLGERGGSEGARAILRGANIQIPLIYPSTALDQIGLFKEYLDLHILLLKSRFHRWGGILK